MSGILTALTESLAQRRGVALATVVRAEGHWAASRGRHALVWVDQEPLSELGLADWEPRVLADARRVLQGKQHQLLDYSREAGQPLQVFVEVQRRPAHLVIVGAGHIAVPLAQLGSLCGFLVTVLDDRAQYAHPSRFPTADTVLAAPLRATVRVMLDDGQLDNDTYIVLVTRGHQHDIDCLLEVLDAPLAYIGMIGSKRRVRTVFQLLTTEQHIPTEKFTRVYAPIGLDIGAHTPAEIAVCIMAEIINVFRGGPARSLSDDRRDRDQRRPSSNLQYPTSNIQTEEPL